MVSVNYLTNDSILDKASRWLLVLLAIGVAGNYLSYSLSWTLSPMETLSVKTPVLSTPRNKEYLIVVPYYAKVYFDYNKNSPDRYFDQYYLLPNYNRFSFASEAERHFQSVSRFQDKTAWVMISLNEFDEESVNKYKEQISQKVNLVWVEGYKEGRVKIDAYVSDTGMGEGK